MSPLRATLGAAPFTIDDLAALAASPARLTLSELRSCARHRVARGRRALRGRRRAGVRPEHGRRRESRVPRRPRRARELPGAAGSRPHDRCGGAAAGAVCRAALIARCIGLAQGGAGISPPVLELLLAMVERGVTPVIPRRGSIGAGDLGLAAHIARRRDRPWGGVARGRAASGRRGARGCGARAGRARGEGRARAVQHERRVDRSGGARARRRVSASHLRRACRCARLRGLRREPADLRRADRGAPSGRGPSRRRRRCSGASSRGAT